MTPIIVKETYVPTANPTTIKNSPKQRLLVLRTFAPSDYHRLEEGFMSWSRFPPCLSKSSQPSSTGQHDSIESSAVNTIHEKTIAGFS